MLFFFATTNILSMKNITITSGKTGSSLIAGYRPPLEKSYMLLTTEKAMREKMSSAMQK